MAGRQSSRSTGFATLPIQSSRKTPANLGPIRHAIVDGTRSRYANTTAGSGTDAAGVHASGSQASPTIPVAQEPANTTQTKPPPKKARKERGPNWEANEVFALIDAKHRENDDEESCIDKRHLMQPEFSKWQRINADVMRRTASSNHRDGAACKAKWNQLIPDYKRITDFFNRTGTNGMTYWTMSRSEKKAEGLPQCFPKEVFYGIHEWYSKKPTIRPPHTRDTLSKEDSNYKSAAAMSDDFDDNDTDFDEDDNDFSGPAFTADTQERSESTKTPLFCRQNVAGRGRATLSTSARTPRGCLPAGVVPQVISSSNTNTGASSQPLGSTGVRRRTVSGHTLLVEATRATGQVMAGQMKEIAEANREVERNKIDVQFKLFQEQMKYYRERDMRLHENAQLAIHKQGQVVQCLAHLSNVLSAKLQPRYPVNTVRPNSLAGGAPPGFTTHAGSTPAIPPPVPPVEEVAESGHPTAPDSTTPADA